MCSPILSGGPESGGNTAVVLVIQALTARTVSCGVKQILLLNTHRLTFIEVCLPSTCLISIDFNWRRSGNCNSVDRLTNAKRAPCGQNPSCCNTVVSFHTVLYLTIYSRNTLIKGRSTVVVLCNLDSNLSEICYLNVTMHPDPYPVRCLSDAACLGADTNTHICKHNTNNTKHINVMVL